MMKGAVLLSLVAFCGLMKLSEGTSCTAATLKTCKKTLWATGKCSSDVCACVSGYVPGPFGCQVKQKAAIVTTPLYFNGEGEVGATLVLTCTKGADDAYKWFKGETALSETTRTLTLTLELSHSGDYTCQSTIAGVLSTASDAVSLEVLIKASLTKLPVITGMPQKAFLGMESTLTCTNVPAASGDYAWNNGGPIAGETGQTYVYTYADEKEIKCTIGGKESATVASPVSASDDIDGVVLKASATKLIVGEALILTCELTGGFTPGYSSDVAYNFNRNGGSDITAASGTNTHTIIPVATTDSGSWTCSGKFKSSAPKESSAMTVTVVDTMESSPVTTSSSKVLQKGYYYLTCNFNAVDTSIDVTYKWQKDGVELPGVTDKTLQFNVPEADYDGVYTCTTTSADGSVTAVAKTIAAELNSDFEGSTPTIGGTAATYGLGNTYMFVCQSAFNSPGVTYEWKVGTEVQSETSETFSYKATSTSTAVACKAKFGSVSSTAATETVQGAKIVDVSILVSGETVTAPTPVHSSKLKFACVVEKGKGASESITYKWKKDGVDTDPLVTTKEYEFTTPASGTSGIVILCEATVGGENEDKSLTVTPTATNPKPAVMASADPIFLGADIYIICVSNANGEDATYEWKKGSTVISGATSRKHKINDVAAADEGDYACKMTINSVESVYSEAKTLTTTVDRACTFSDDCDFPNFDSTKCVDSKCQCKSGFDYKGGECSGASAILGSLMLMLAAALFQRIL